MSKDINNPHFAGKYFEEIDEISESENYFTPVLTDVALHIDFSKANVLDVGCGTGLFLKPVIKAGCKNCYGVDGPTEFTHLAIERGYKEVKEIGDLCTTPIPYLDENFDLVICKDVFEHLINPIYTLLEIKRVIKPNGLLLLHVPNHFPIKGRLKFLLNNNIDTFGFFKEESRWTFPHIRFYEHNEMLNVLKKQGFSLITDLSFHFPSIPLLSRFNIFQKFQKYLVKHYPSQFASGFTLLVKKD